MNCKQFITIKLIIKTISQNLITYCQNQNTVELVILR